MMHKNAIATSIYLSNRFQNTSSVLFYTRMFASKIRCDHEAGHNPDQEGRHGFLLAAISLPRFPRRLFHTSVCESWHQMLHCSPKMILRWKRSYEWILAPNTLGPSLEVTRQIHALSNLAFRIQPVIEWFLQPQCSLSTCS